MRKLAEWFKPYLPTLVMIGVMVTPRLLLAGTDTTFDDVSMMFGDWISGSLGKTFSLLALTVGAAIAAIRQSFIALFAAVGVAAAANVGPGILEGIIEATF